MEGVGREKDIATYRCRKRLRREKGEEGNGGGGYGIGEESEEGRRGGDR